MATTNNNPTTFKVVKKLENGYLIQELILTNEWAKLVNKLQAKNFSDDGISAILMPYDSTKKAQEIDNNLVEFCASYFKKSL